jgi:hemerythrin HHE cation binding domain-containing protein
MAVTDTRPPNPQGEALVAELKWVHDMIRRDLATVRQMAADVAAGLPAGKVTAAIRTLAASGPLWQLRINCLQYCRIVHSHHHAESVMLFPELRRADPALNPVVDKLEADHVRVSGLLEDVEAAARDLSRAENHGAPGNHGSPENGAAHRLAPRQRLAAALDTLSADLLAHLQYEEEQISGTLRTWTTWPGW